MPEELLGDVTRAARRQQRGEVGGMAARGDSIRGSSSRDPAASGQAGAAITSRQCRPALRPMRWSQLGTSWGLSSAHTQPGTAPPRTCPSSWMSWPCPRCSGWRTGWGAPGPAHPDGPARQMGTRGAGQGEGTTSTTRSGGHCGRAVWLYQQLLGGHPQHAGSEVGRRRCDQPPIAPLAAFRTLAITSRSLKLA